MRARLGASLFFAAALTAVPRVEVLAQNTGAPATRAATATPTSSAAFTMNDALDITSATVADLSDDGRWLALTSVRATRRVRTGLSSRRRSDLCASGTRRACWSSTRNPARRSPVFAGQAARFASRAGLPTATVSPCWSSTATCTSPRCGTARPMHRHGEHLPAGKLRRRERATSVGRPTASRSSSPCTRRSGARRLATRSPTMTDGPVFVQSSVDPFLAWDDVRRMGNVRSIVAFDLQTNVMRDLVPETMVGQYTLAEGRRRARLQRRHPEEDRLRQLQQRDVAPHALHDGRRRASRLRDDEGDAAPVGGRRKPLRVLEGRPRLRRVDRRKGREATRSGRRSVKPGETPTPPDTYEGRPRARRARALLGRPLQPDGRRRARRRTAKDSGSSTSRPRRATRSRRATTLRARPHRASASPRGRTTASIST